MEETLDLSIIIINYNTCEETGKCIESVFEKTADISFEVILVDNASKDGSKEVFEADSRIRYIYNDENLGFGRANNVGIEVSRGRNVLFLNSDTLLRNDACSILSRYLDQHERIGVVGGNLYNADGHPTHSYRKYFPSVYSEMNDILSGLPNKLIYGKNAEFNYSGTPKRVKMITGADLMIRRAVLDEIGGGFDPDFFMYFEDTELCWRVCKAGYEIVSVPQAEIVHLTGYSSKKKTSEAKGRILRNSKSLYFSKCLSKPERHFINLIINSKALVKVLVPPYNGDKWMRYKATLNDINNPERIQ